MSRIAVFSVGRDVVRRAVHHEGIRAGIGRKCRRLGNVHRSEQAHAVAHGNAVLVFGVVRANEILVGILRVKLMRTEERGDKDEYDENRSREPPWDCRGPFVHDPSD